MCASLVLSEGGESPARDAGSTARLGDDPLCRKNAGLSPEVWVAEEAGRHESRSSTCKRQEGRARAGHPAQLRFWIPGEGVGQGVLNRRGLRTHREETTADGGSKPRRNRNLNYGRACGGGVSVTWSPDLLRPSGAASRSELLPATAGGCQEGLGEDTEVLFTQVPAKGPEVGWEGAVVILRRSA